jgi:crotonobetainyl-CoA:carnitine CoA-transferase CaiB-like acyl-CoA transferase
MPFRTADGPIDDADPPPSQGEHTRAVLSEFGYDDGTVEELLETGVLLESS